MKKVSPTSFCVLVEVECFYVAKGQSCEAGENEPVTSLVNLASQLGVDVFLQFLLRKRSAFLVRATGNEFADTVVWILRYHSGSLQLARVLAYLHVVVVPDGVVFLVISPTNPLVVIPQVGRSDIGKRLYLAELKEGADDAQLVSTCVVGDRLGFDMVSDVVDEALTLVEAVEHNLGAQNLLRILSIVVFGEQLQCHLLAELLQGGDDALALRHLLLDGRAVGDSLPCGRGRGSHGDVLV